MKIRPLQDHVIIRMDAIRETTEGGLFIPQDIQEAYSRGQFGKGKGIAVGTVLAVGPGDWCKKAQSVRKPIGYEAGQRVVFEPHAGMEIEHDGETVLMMAAEHVMGVVE